MPSPDLSRFDEEVHQVLAYASQLANERKFECISGTHIVYSALIVNQLLADGARRLGISKGEFLRMIGYGKRVDNVTRIPFCSPVERALNSSTGGLKSLLDVLANEDTTLLVTLQEYSSTGAPVDEIRAFLSQDLTVYERPLRSVVERHGEVSGCLRRIESPTDPSCPS